MDRPKRANPQARLLQAISSLVRDKFLPLDEASSSVPRHWDVFGDLILFPENAFTADCWTGMEEELWDAICLLFKVSRIAKHGRIHANDFRSPRVQMLRGDNTWVRKKDNGVVYEFDLTSCMFSCGNITEKIRMSKIDCRDEYIVDLFAGIGYFTIPLLKSGAKWVCACDWNPESVKALTRNIALNGVADRCEILFGDNRKVCPINIADRVVLGLIPTSEISWETACRAIRYSTGGILHVHANVDGGSSIEKPHLLADISRVSITSSVQFKQVYFEKFAMHLLLRLLLICDEIHDDEWVVRLEHLEVVKSYGPKVYHCVYDVRLRPKSLSCD